MDPTKAANPNAVGRPSRRRFLKAALTAATTAGALPMIWPRTTRAALALRRPNGTPKIAAVITEWRGRKMRPSDNIEKMIKAVFNQLESFDHQM